MAPTTYGLRALFRIGDEGLVSGLDFWRGGSNWVALVFATLTSPLTVFGPVWLLGLAQRHLDRRLRWAGPAVARTAYGAFVVQAVVVIGLAVLLRPVPALAEVKAVLLAGGGIWGSFALARLLINRVPGAGRVL